MNYKRFEDLPVWKAAARLFVDIDRLCESPDIRRHGDLADQIHRAALSVSNNIAEGFEQGTTQQFITHLYHAKGSAGEVRSMLTIMAGTPRLKGLRTEISRLRSLVENLSRQIYGLADAAQNSPIRGHRYLTDTVRENTAASARREAFEAKLEAMVAAARVEREGKARDDPG